MENELTHYGVLGMRWGVHKAKWQANTGRRHKALGRTEKMMRKYDRRMQRNLLKIKMNDLSGHFRNADYKAKKYVKAKKYAEAAAYVYDKMVSTFGETTLSILANSQGVSYGERYLDWRRYADED